MTTGSKTKRETIWKWTLDLDTLDAEGGALIDFPFGARLLYAAAQHRRVVIYAIVDPEEKDILRRPVYVVGTGNAIAFDTTAKTPLGVVALYEGRMMLHVFVGGYDPNEFMAIYGKRNDIDPGRSGQTGMYAKKATG